MSDDDAKPRKTPPKCNELGGKRWLQNSISVWDDIRKTTEEVRLKHPAMFPTMLVERLIETFLRPEGHIILDPFCGSGSTLVAAEKLGKQGIGFEISPEFIAMARQRLAPTLLDPPPQSIIHQRSVRELIQVVEPESVDLCITSPPYWGLRAYAGTTQWEGGDAECIHTITHYNDNMKPNVDRPFRGDRSRDRKSTRLNSSH